MDVAAAPYRFDAAEVLERAKRRLLDRVPEDEAASRGDDDLNPHARAIPHDVPFKPAAVLVPIVPRQEGATLLLTQRTQHLPSHAGQVAFPGGKIDATDAGPVEAALRETEEETGVEPRFVTPLGFLDLYITRTGYRVVPVVALLEPGFALRPEPGEVEAIFEVPLSFLMDPKNHARHSRVWQGLKRHYYAMPFGDRYIWGATAGMIRNLYDRLYA